MSFARVIGKKNRQMAAPDSACSADMRTIVQMPAGRSLIGRLQQSVILYLDRLVALAGGFSQTLQVCDFDMSAAVADDSGLLKRMGDDRNRVALHADHLRQEFLGQRQVLAVGQVARAQQPARQARFDGMRRIACGGLLGLCEQRLFMSYQQGSKGAAPVGGGPKVRNIENRGCAWLHNDRVGLASRARNAPSQANASLRPISARQRS